MKPKLSLPVKRKEQDVDLGDEPYVLIEMDGNARDSYLNDMVANAKTNPRTGAAVGVKRFDGLQASLIVRCLKKVNPQTGERSETSKEFVQGLPATTQNALFDECRELNGLDDAEDDEDSPGED